MDGVRSLDEIYAFYRDDKTIDYSRSTMLRFLDLVADVLRSKPLFYSTSHARLGISRFGTWTESTENPSIMIVPDDRWVSLVYHESWDDGLLIRKRWDEIKCLVENARTPLLEMLARLRV